MTTAGSAKIQMLLELKNGMKAGLDKAKAMVSKDTAEIKGKLASLKTNHIESFSTMKNEIPGLGGAIGMLTNPVTLAIAAVGGLAAVFTSAKNQAAEWELGMAKINVTAGMGKDELGGLSQKILDIGANSVIPLEQVPAAFNRIISSGLDVNTSLATLEPTLMAAKVGFMDAETAASAAVNVMNSSGIMDANRVWDILTATTKEGNAEFKDIANYLPKIIPGARAAGHSLEEVGGAFAFLTGQGQNAEAATTGLTNLYKSISTGTIKDKLKDAGINVFDNLGNPKPLIGIIDELKKKTDGLTPEGKVDFMSRIGFDMETGNALNSMMQNFDKLKTNIDHVTNSKGALEKAFTDSSTAGDVFQKMKNQVSKAMVELGTGININWGSIGNEIMPMFTSELETIMATFKGIWDLVVPIGKALWDFSKPISNAVLSIGDFLSKSEMVSDIFTGIEWIVGKIGKLLGGIGTAISQLWTEVVQPIVSRIEGIYVGIKEFLNIGNKKDDNGIPGAKQTAVGMEWAGLPGQTNFANGANPYGLSNSNANLYAPAKPVADKPGKPKASKEGSGTSISGKAEQVRNITIHINTLGVSGDFVSNSTDFSSMNKRDLQNWFNDMLNRFAQNLETSYG